MWWPHSGKIQVLERFVPLPVKLICGKREDLLVGIRSFDHLFQYTLGESELDVHTLARPCLHLSTSASISESER